MSAVLNDLGRYLWRLGPANPILVRVVYADGRRVRHLWLRTAYLAILATLTVIGVLAMQSSRSSLTDLAKNATQVFQVVSIVQLGLVCVLAPVFTAAAITQEKDSQTFNILLSTPLTNAQIVLGSLLSRLYFVLVLLLAGIPLLALMMVYGGVTGDKIALSMMIAAGTATLTASLAIAISVIKIGTGRTIFTFYLAIAIYLITLYVLGLSGWFPAPQAQPAPGRTAVMSLLAPFHPFLSLWVVLGLTPAPPAEDVAHHGLLLRSLLAHPHVCYIGLTLLAAAFLIGLSLLFVRRGAKEGEDTLINRLSGWLKSARRAGTDNRPPRKVWHNPIAWREASTSAAAGGGVLVRYGLLLVGLTLAVVILILYRSNRLTVTECRLWLYAVVEIELLIALFLATAAAATSMTREKESNTLELVLATPLTSDAIIKGKIVGLVGSAGPLLAIPLLTVLLFVFVDAVTGRMSAASRTEPVLHWEVLFTLPLVMVAYTAFVCMLGLQASIKSRKTLTAVFSSMGIVIGVYTVTAGCAFAVMESDARIAAAFMPINPVSAPYVLLDPRRAVEAAAGTLQSTDLYVCRVIAMFASIVAASLYGLVGFGLHRSMVRNFDMIIRKQSA